MKRTIEELTNSVANDISELIYKGEIEEINDIIIICRFYLIQQKIVLNF